MILEVRELAEKSCSSNCNACDKNGSCTIRKEVLLEGSRIGRVVGIISGKGGVGKSTVTAMLARQLNDKGYKVGILDGDITGPSIPKLFGVSDSPVVEEKGIYPSVTTEGIRIMSMNLLLDNEEEPVIYRGPVIASFIKEFWSKVIWGELDILLIDMPPGTGDVPLTVYQSLPIDGIVMVTSPQSLVKMIVMKAVNMAKKMSVPLLGIVENYSYFVCDNCDKKHYIFGESKIAELAAELETRVIGELPILPELTENADRGLGSVKAPVLNLNALFIDN